MRPPSSYNWSVKVQVLEQECASLNQQLSIMASAISEIRNNLRVQDHLFPTVRLLESRIVDLEKADEINKVRMKTLEAKIVTAMAKPKVQRVPEDFICITDGDET